jgi:hypothetical protein
MIRFYEPSLWIIAKLQTPESGLAPRAVRQCRRARAFLLASVAGSFGFYLITNTASWLTSTGYHKTAAGWIQALTVGLPAYPPTWLFFRNSFVSDACFTVSFLACLKLAGIARSPVGTLTTASRLNEESVSGHLEEIRP